MIFKIIKFYFAQLWLIHIGKHSMQAQATIKLALMTSPVVFIIEGLTKWTWDNSLYIIVVMGAIIADHLLGSIKHFFYDKDFSLKKNGTGLLIKVGMVVIGGFLFEGLKVIVDHDSILKDYLIIVTRLIVFLYPAGSAFGNMSVITNGKIPPKAFMDKVGNFQKNLNPKELTNKDENNGSINN